MLGVANAGGRTLAVSPVTVQVIGKGTVSSSPAGVNCGDGATACHLAFSGNATITLLATPAAGWAFEAWTNCPTAPIGNTCEVTVDGNLHEVTANFTGPPTTTSTLSVTYAGSGNVSGGGIDCGSSPAGSACTSTVLTGSTLTVRETPAASNVFAGWGGACSGSNVACTVALAGDRSVGAAWVGSQAVLLTVSVSGSGTVTGGGISCPSTCAASHPMNSTVVLTAAAAPGYVFTGWDGACSGTAASCSVLMDGAQSVTASFAEVVELTATVAGNGNVSGEGGAINCGSGANICSARFPLNRIISLAATAATGATFTGWSGACGGTASSCTILMSAPKSITASFSGGAGATVPLTVAVSGPGTVTGGGIHCGGGGTTCSSNLPDELVRHADSYSGIRRDVRRLGRLLQRHHPVVHLADDHRQERQRDLRRLHRPTDRHRRGSRQRHRRRPRMRQRSHHVQGRPGRGLDGDADGDTSARGEIHRLGRRVQRQGKDVCAEDERRAERLRDVQRGGRQDAHDPGPRTRIRTLVGRAMRRPQAEEDLRSALCLWPKSRPDGHRGAGRQLPPLGRSVPGDEKNLRSDVERRQDGDRHLRTATDAPPRGPTLTDSWPGQQVVVAQRKSTSPLQGRETEQVADAGAAHFGAIFRA